MNKGTRTEGIPTIGKTAKSDSTSESQKIFKIKKWHSGVMN